MTDISAIENEKILINIALLDNSTVPLMVGTYKVDPMKFLVRQNGIVFGIIYIMVGDGIKADIVSLVSFAEKIGKLEEAGGAAYIASLTDIVSSVANLDYYCKHFAEDWRQRTIKQSAKELLSHADGTPAELEEAFRKFEEMKQALDSEMVETDIYSGGRLKEIAQNDIDFNISHKQGFIGVPCGISKIDEATRGFRGGDLVSIAAVAGGGKSAMADTMIYNILSNGYRVAFFSLEMPKEQILERLISLESLIPLQDIRSGNVSEADRERAFSDSVFFKENFFLVDTPLIEFSELQSMASNLVSVQKVDIIFIDYAQLIRTKGAAGKKGYELLSELADNLKAMAKRLNVPVVVLSQLNSRGYEGAPGMEDLGGGLALTKSSDYILIIYNTTRTDKDGGTSVVPDVKEMKIAKARNARTGKFKVSFNPKFLRFSDYAGE